MDKEQNLLFEIEKLESERKEICLKLDAINQKLNNKKLEYYQSQNDIVIGDIVYVKRICFICNCQHRCNCEFCDKCDCCDYSKEFIFKGKVIDLIPMLTSDLSTIDYLFSQKRSFGYRYRIEFLEDLLQYKFSDSQYDDIYLRHQLQKIK